MSVKRRKKATRASPNGAVFVRLAAAVVAKIDAVAERESRTSISPITRSDVIRYYVVAGLAKDEQDHRD